MGEIIPFPCSKVPFPVLKIFPTYFRILRSYNHHIPKVFFDLRKQMTLACLASQYRTELG